MSSTSELEQQVNELRQQVTAPTPAEVLAETERQLAVALETEAQAAAEKWMLGNARAIGGAGSELEKALDRLRDNPNAADVERANRIWEGIRTRYELAEVVQRRCPRAKQPATPTVLPPGRRGLKDVAGLSIEMPRRYLFPVVVASDSPQLRERLFQHAAYEYLRGQTLPDELRGALTPVPEPDTSERIATDRAATQRQRANAERVARTW